MVIIAELICELENVAVVVGIAVVDATVFSQIDRETFVTDPASVVFRSTMRVKLLVTEFVDGAATLNSSVPNDTNTNSFACDNEPDAGAGPTERVVDAPPTELTADLSTAPVVEGSSRTYQAYTPGPWKLNVHDVSPVDAAFSYW